MESRQSCIHIKCFLWGPECTKYSETISCRSFPKSHGLSSRNSPLPSFRLSKRMISDPNAVGALDFHPLVETHCRAEEGAGAQEGQTGASVFVSSHSCGLQQHSQSAFLGTPAHHALVSGFMILASRENNLCHIYSPRASVLL